MKKIFILTSFFFSLELQASSFPKELNPIFTQQQAFHQSMHVREALLMDIAAVMQEKAYKAKKTYLFWGGAQEKRPQFVSFLDMLKLDLGMLGVDMSDRVQNHKKKPTRKMHDEHIDSIEKMLLFMTADMGLYVESRSYEIFYDDWKRVEARLVKPESRTSQSDLVPLTQGAVLPLFLDGYSLGLRKIILDSEGVVLDEVNIASATYLHLLIHLVRFSADIPGDVDYAEGSLRQIWQCFPDFKKAMGW